MFWYLHPVRLALKMQTLIISSSLQTQCFIYSPLPPPPSIHLVPPLHPPCCVGQHFIDKHRIQLIESISTVEPILDRLRTKNVITQENYSHIRSKSTSIQRMRELFELGSIRSTTKGKDCLYDVLMELEPLIMDKLKETGVWWPTKTWAWLGDLNPAFRGDPLFFMASLYPCFKDTWLNYNAID